MSSAERSEMTPSKQRSPRLSLLGVTALGVAGLMLFGSFSAAAADDATDSSVSVTSESTTDSEASEAATTDESTADSEVQAEETTTSDDASDTSTEEQAAAPADDPAPADEADTTTPADPSPSENKAEEKSTSTTKQAVEDDSEATQPAVQADSELEVKFAKLEAALDGTTPVVNYNVTFENVSEPISLDIYEEGGATPVAYIGEIDGDGNTEGLFLPGKCGGEYTYEIRSSDATLASLSVFVDCPPDTSPKKVFVCKYVGTPGVDERLQTGNNPISVSVNAIQNNQWDGSVPGWFSDAHDRSYVLAYNTGQPKPSVSDCPQPEGPPPGDECVQDVKWSYTFDGVGSGTITASAKDAEEGDTLCDPLAVRATTYTYDLPASGNPSWPQTPDSSNDVLVDSIGTFSYAAPALESCRQHDIYAEFVSKGGFDALPIPEKLYGPNNPFEPPFLHDTLKGKGPKPTHSTTSSEGCNTPPETPDAKITHTEWVTGEYKCKDTTVTETRTKVTTPWKYIIVDGKWKLVPDTANATSEPETRTRPLTEEELKKLDCTPDLPMPPGLITGTSTSEVKICKPGTRNHVHVDGIQDGIWTFTDKDDNTFVTKVGEGYDGDLPKGLVYGLISIVLSDAGTDETTQVVANDSYWTPVDPASLDCDTTASPNPEESTPPPALAVTGGSALPLWVIWSGLAFVVAGCVLVLIELRRRAMSMASATASMSTPEPDETTIL